MQIWRCTAFLFLALALTAPLSTAGTVELNVQVCGISSPYVAYGETTYAIAGESSTGLKKEFFRIKGYLNLEENLGDSKQSRQEATLEFISSLQIKGIHLCVRGNLETRRREEKTLYYLYPRKFQILEAPGLYLKASQLRGVYSLETASPENFSLISLPDSERGRTFFVFELVSILRKLLEQPCDGLEQKAATLNELNFTLLRAQKNTLTASLNLKCSDGDSLRILIEFDQLAGKKDAIEGLFSIERPTKSWSLSLPIKQIKFAPDW